MSYRIIKSIETTNFNISGVDITNYGKITDNLAVITQTVEKGHFEEFVHDKSTFIYLFLEGKGIFILNDEKVEVNAGDMLIINPGTRIHYFGTLKQLLITTPAYEEKYERHIKNIDENENPFLE